jgi:hypothetical protein
MMKKIGMLLVLGIMLAGLLAVPVLAAGPGDNPGNGPPTLDRVIFINYPRDFAAKGSPGGKPTDTAKEFYKYSGYHWNTSDVPVVNYYVNLNGSGGGDSFLTGIENSFQVWENNSSIDFYYVDSFATTPSSFYGAGSTNNKNEVGWVDISKQYPNAIAVTMVWYNPATREISEIDMAMNKAFRWTQNTIDDDPDSSYGDAGFYDVQNIATHEAGHWLMLGDLYNKPTTEQTMYGYGSTGEVKKRSLESGDLAGAKAIYP